MTIVSSLAKILRRIVVTGQVVTYPTTFIEGWTFTEIRQALEAAEHLLPDSVGLSDQEILAAIGSDYGHPEGLFFPDTYHSVRGYSQLSMLSRAYQAMEAETCKFMVWASIRTTLGRAVRGADSGFNHREGIGR